MQLAHDVLGPRDAPQMVLIHGITESRHSWQPVIDRLVADHRLLAVDLRGHGASPDGDAYDPVSYAADVAETAASAGFQRPLVIGHSLGGAVASAYGAVGECRGIINVDQPLRLGAFKEALTQLEPMLKGSNDEFLAARNAMFSAMDGPLPEAERQRIEAHGRADQAVVLGTWAIIFDSTAEEIDAAIAAILPTITMPYLSLHGIQPPPDYAAWLHESVPQALVEEWPDHGHYPHLVDTPRFVARVLEFDASLG